MPTELNLRFPDTHHVIVRLLGDGQEDDGSAKIPFVNPLGEKDLRAMQWYVETYGAHSLGDPDDVEAKRIAGLLPVWGAKLFKAVFNTRESQRRFIEFQDAEDDNRLLTISSEHPTILALPWELLHDPAAGGGFLFMEHPRISIRRRVAGATGGRRLYRPAAKDALHILFVVSRPAEAGFFDPRADSLPVLDAIDRHAPGRVTYEFLRPPTLDALVERLEARSQPAVDIVHFDGHGIFDREGNLPNRAAAARITSIARLEELLRQKKTHLPVSLDPDCPPNMGYLLFEKPDGGTHFVSAQRLGDNLHRHQVALVILSACQSATMAEKQPDKDDKAEQPTDDEAERPMGGVAARLTATGIPSVLAMTHSVLVATTRVLFGQFYKELARHKAIGEALDNARRHLFNHPERYEVQRGSNRIPLKLYDWFLPALYQPGTDGALLNPGDGSGPAPAATRPRTELPKPPDGGFFGRKRSLWKIERWFAGPTRRITLTGFGGQGKTALAREAGWWLTRTGLFQAAVFVDYSRVQAADAVAVATSALGTVLDQSFPDAAAATAALEETPTLVILDNLEALAPAALRELLDAAVPWSEAGGSRVLCTTRRPDFGHADYRVEGTRDHRRIRLDGLGTCQAPDDALEWCGELMKLPPAPTVPAPQRESLIRLFDRVQFHPLSIRVLAQQLKTRPMAEVRTRLEQLLTQLGAGVSPGADPAEDTPAGLLASLELSLDRLDAVARHVLPRLGVFQGGAMEDSLIAITGLGDAYESQRFQLQQQLAAVEQGSVRLEGDKKVPPEILEQLKTKLREELANLPPPPEVNLWLGLRRQLEAAALIQPEDLPGVSVPFLRFHPTLAPLLAAQLDPAERDRLSTAHRQRYYALAGVLYREDDRHPHAARAIAWRELPNLLHAVHAVHAVHAALDAGDPHAVEFADNVNLFLGYFGLKREAERLSARAQQAAGEPGSQAWFLAQSTRAEQLLEAGQVAKAQEVFQAILQQLGDAASYQRALTLRSLGQCFRAGGRPDWADQTARQAIQVCDQLEPSDTVKRLRAALLTDLADALREQGQYTEARQEYQHGLTIVEELNDLRSQGAVLGQRGTLAMLEGDLREAVELHRDALALFGQLREPAMEAVGWHQLGRVFQKARQWDEAERHYRESARIREERGNLAGAAQTWNQLAIVSEQAGKPDAAEMWFRKAIEGGRKTGDLLPTSRALNNLANLLQSRPGRLAEARQLAKEALAIMRTLDPGAAEIWTTYNILAEIAIREAQATSDPHRQAELEAQARNHRRLARQAQRNFAGTRHQLQRHLPLISTTIMAAQDSQQNVALDHVLTRYTDASWKELVSAVHRIVAGERDEDTLCADLGSQNSMIIATILAGLADPSTLADLLPSEPPESS